MQRRCGTFLQIFTVEKFPVQLSNDICNQVHWVNRLVTGRIKFKHLVKGRDRICAGFSKICINAAIANCRKRHSVARVSFSLTTTPYTLQDTQTKHPFVPFMASLEECARMPTSNAIITTFILLLPVSNPLLHSFEHKSRNMFFYANFLSATCQLNCMQVI